MKNHPNLSHVHLLEEADNSPAAIAALLKDDFITLIVLKRPVEGFEDFLDSASLACSQAGALRKQRVILIEQEAAVQLLRELPVPLEEPALPPSASAPITPASPPTETGLVTMEKEIARTFAELNPSRGTLKFDSLLAFSVFPTTGKVAYVVTNDGANFIEVDMAFAKVIAQLPN